MRSAGLLWSGSAMSKPSGRLIDHVVSRRHRETNRELKWSKWSSMSQETERVLEPSGAFRCPQRWFSWRMKNLPLKISGQLFHISRVNLRVLACEVHFADNFGPVAGGCALAGDKTRRREPRANATQRICVGEALKMPRVDTLPGYRYFPRPSPAFR